MSRSLSALVARVSDFCAERNDIERLRGVTQKIVQQAKEEEAADVLAMLLLFARHNDIDLDAALERKWFSHLPG